MILELIERLSREAGKRELDFLLIGGHAVIQHGYPRMTLDVDFLCRTQQRDQWRAVLEPYGYKVYSEANAFSQFAGAPNWPKVDLMFVNDGTFEKLKKESVKKESLRVPSVQHLIALKLHATRSATRSSPQKDWGDIEALIRLHRLDPATQDFHDLILRYGGEESLVRIREIWQRFLMQEGHQ